MDGSDNLDFLIDHLSPGAMLPTSTAQKWRYFRSLVNLREPGPASEEFLGIQDAFLQAEIEAKGISRVESLVPIEDRIHLWQGDITTLRVDGIVNAANSSLLGCFHPCHGCIDNAIHTFAGVQLRNECAKIMKGHLESIGQAKITEGYNLPARHVLHTVGPTISGPLRPRDRAMLGSCYQSCLALAEAQGLRTLAFCCISTGEFRFPPREAARIAIDTVRRYLCAGSSLEAVVFNVFKTEDLNIYRSLLDHGETALEQPQPRERNSSGCSHCPSRPRPKK